jgi:NIPSNAP
MLEVVINQSDRVVPPASMARAGLIELRQYTLRLGTRDTLLDVFERFLIDGQEAVGMRIGGTYLDSRDANRFVWMRGFHDLEQRRQALDAFYSGPIWMQHRGTANPTMIDSDDVLLLRPTVPAHPPALPSRNRPEPGLADAPEHRVRLSVYAYEPEAELTHWLSTTVHAALERYLEASIATWRTDPGPNTFPQLPVRDENTFVWSASFEDAEAMSAAELRLESAPQWHADIAPRLRSHVVEQRLHLQPTARSQHPQPTAPSSMTTNRELQQ